MNTTSGPVEVGPTEADLLHLRRAIALAMQARAAGQHPFGALVVDENGKCSWSGESLPAAGGRSHAARRNGCREARCPNGFAGAAGAGDSLH